VPDDPVTFALLAALVLVAAVLYSSGGHGGASAYLALMAMFSVAPAALRPTALLMNIAVASIGTTRFVRAGAVPWPILRPLCLGSLPAACVGGATRLAPGHYLAVLGVVLLAAAALLARPPRTSSTREAPRVGWLVAIGAALGYVAGLTGIGGGIFLSPLLLLTGWEEPRRTSGAAAAFILLNSMLGLLGNVASVSAVPAEAAWLGATAVAGGLLGSWLGAQRLGPLALRRVHAVVLLVSGAKLILESVRG
jgi:uncharacterized membrane protein YfcA